MGGTQYFTGTGGLVINNGTFFEPAWVQFPNMPYTINAGNMYGWGSSVDGNTGAGFGGSVTINAGGELDLIWQNGGSYNQIASSTTFNLNGGYFLPISANNNAAAHTETSAKSRWAAGRPSTRSPAAAARSSTRRAAAASSAPTTAP